MAKKEKFKKAAPIAVGGAVTGIISSILKAPLTGGSGLGVLGMQLLPGGILGGAIMGMGVVGYGDHVRLAVV